MVKTWTMHSVNTFGKWHTYKHDIIHCKITTTDDFVSMNTYSIHNYNRSLIDINKFAIADFFMIHIFTVLYMATLQATNCAQLTP